MECYKAGFARVLLNHMFCVFRGYTQAVKRLGANNTSTRNFHHCNHRLGDTGGARKSFITGVLSTTVSMLANRNRSSQTGNLRQS